MPNNKTHEGKLQVSFSNLSITSKTLFFSNCLPSNITFHIYIYIYIFNDSYLLHQLIYTKQISIVIRRFGKVEMTYRNFLYFINLLCKSNILKSNLAAKSCNSMLNKVHRIPFAELWNFTSEEKFEISGKLFTHFMPR